MMPYNFRKMLLPKLLRITFDRGKYCELSERELLI